MLFVKPWSLLFVFAISGCATHLPYNPPTLLPADSTAIDEDTLIPYRTLIVDDFKATKFFGQKAPDVDGEVGAATVVVIRATPCMIRAFARSNADSAFFEAMVDSFRYEARFNQTKSWFIPSQKAAPGELLEHEQIHFAISELAVRRANADIAAIRARIRACAREKMVAVDLARQRFQEELDRVIREASERQEQFDKDTVNGTILGYNKYWSVRIRNELKLTEPKPAATSPP